MIDRGRVLFGVALALGVVVAGAALTGCSYWRPGARMSCESPCWPGPRIDWVDPCLCEEPCLEGVCPPLPPKPPPPPCSPPHPAPGVPGVTLP